MIDFDFNTFLLIIFIIGFILYKIGIIKKYINLDFFKNKKKEENEFELVNIGKVFTNTELKFYNELSKLVDNKKYFLLSKIRLIDLVWLKKAEYSKYMKIFNKLSKKHIDFIIIDKYGKIILLIELDDKYHNNKKSKINDKFKNDLFSYLNVLLVRFNVGNSYNFEKIKDILV